MVFLDIALPLKIAGTFTYRSSVKIEPGCRVIVNCNNREYTGFVVSECAKSDVPEYRVKDVLEVIDETPILKKSQLTLARWMCDYYQEPFGLVLFAMLPSAVRVTLQHEVRRLIDTIPDKHPHHKLLEQIPKDRWIEKRLINGSPGFKLLESLELEGLIAIQRHSDPKVKGRKCNWVIPIGWDDREPLTSKQRAAWTLIGAKKRDFPLSEISSQVSASVLGVLRKKEMIRLEMRPAPVENPAEDHPVEERVEHLLTAEQATAVEKISKRITQNRFEGFLLWGVTGSGKTEVYIRVIREALKKGKSAVVIVPEIALTPQLTARFRAAFEEDVAILHSGLTPTQRFRYWQSARIGKSRVVLGARSAIFAPVQNPGVFIVDEEHEGSYKQESSPRYHARDLALVRGSLENAVTVLGSATPSLESYTNVSRKKLELIELQQRPAGNKLPEVQVVDMREQAANTVISQELAEAVEERLQKNEQIMILLNRRGHSSFLQCVKCGQLFQCPNCDVSMVYHSKDRRLSCHHCGYRVDSYERCPSCGGFVYNFGTEGTQKAEIILKELFPSARILRMDTDTTSNRTAYTRMFERMRDGMIDILLGTQMIAKGLDFAKVTLAAVLNIEATLGVPDFRSSERTFQLITQLAGRSGRKSPGQVIIQTRIPDHYAIKYGVSQDFKAFAEKEMTFRKALFYPPYARIVRFLFSHGSLDVVRKAMPGVKQVLNGLSRLFPNAALVVQGPFPAPYPRIKRLYRYHFLLRSASVEILSGATKYIRQNLNLPGSIKIAVDFDPVLML